MFFLLQKSIIDIAEYVDNKNNYRNNYRNNYHYLIDIANLINLLGIIFYLELIEFNFCGLNYNLKKNILERSIQDSNIELFKDNIEENN